MSTGNRIDDGDASTACRSCLAPSDHLNQIVDFGLHPHASSFPLPTEAGPAEPRWPLRVAYCEACHLVQLVGDVPEEPTTPGPAPWTTALTLEHQARGLVAEAVQALALSASNGPVVEVASHGNYLQPLFHEAGRSTRIIERTSSTAQRAADLGLDLISGDVAAPEHLAALAERSAVVVDHYALAHHPDPHRAMAGLARLLAPDGVAIIEFDSLLPSMETGEFDGFRHGHFSYWSMLALQHLLGRNGLTAVDASRHEVYGGVLRVLIRHVEYGASPGPSVRAQLDAEHAAGMADPSTYRAFGVAIRRTCHDLCALVDEERASGGRVAAYGAPSRGNTLLNACDIRRDRLEFTVDRSVWKQGRVLPGSGIPIRPPAALGEGITLALILTWDIAAEVAQQLRTDLISPPRLAVPFPQVRLLDPDSVATRP